MTKYVFFTLNLCAMHGANMYIYNKTQYLKDHGVKVLVFSAEQGDIVIPGLREYKGCQEPYLRFYPGCFTYKKVNKFIDSICKKIDYKESDEIIIESTNIYSALWGEILAKRLGCKHLAIILQERFGYSADEKKYLQFKLNRHELSGINNLAVRRMLENDDLPFDDSMQIVAHCNNTIDQCEDEITPKLNPKATLTIGSIGRLEKKYVLPLAEELGKYCRKNADKTYNVVFIGGTREEKQPGRIEAAFEKCNNVTLLLPGAMFPIPRDFVDKCDLFISAAGSAWATYYLDRPTIIMNPSTGDIIGILGLTCRQGEFTLYSSNYPVSDIGSMIEQLLDNKDQIEYLGIMQDGLYQKTVEEEFERQLKFVNLCTDYQYYDTYRIKFRDKKYLLFNMLGKVVSAKLLYKSLVFARRCIK